MIKCISTIILLFLSLAIDAQAVEIAGNSHIAQGELLAGVNSAISDDSLIGHIKETYLKEGYFNVIVSQIVINKKGEKAVTIDEGHQAKIESIDIETLPARGNIDFSEQVREITGQSASKANLDYFAEQCISYLAENGMPFASGAWRDFKFSPSGDLIADFRIMTGPRTFIVGIKYRGLKRTRPETLNRILQIRPGQPFSESSLGDAEKRLDQMPYIELVAPFAIEPLGDGDSCYIVFYLKENPSTRFDGAVGLASTQGKSNFVGRLDLELGDILGTGRAFGFNWNRKDRLSSELKVSYFEPFVLSSSLDLTAEAFQLDRDSLYITYGGTLGISHRFGAGLSGALSLTIGRTVPETGSRVIGSTNRAVGLVFEFDRTDLRENPKSGYDIMTSIDYKYRSNRIDSLSTTPLPTKLTSAGAELDSYLRLARQFVIAAKFSGWGIISSDADPPADELVYLGGFDNLRGYTERRFPAERYFLSSIEPRLISGKYSRVYLFGDLAAIDNGVDDRYHLWPGYGLGLAAPSMLGQFKLEIGWGKSGFPSDAIFNFGIAGKF